MVWGSGSWGVVGKINTSSNHDGHHICVRGPRTHLCSSEPCFTDERVGARGGEGHRAELDLTPGGSVLNTTDPLSFVPRPPSADTPCGFSEGPMVLFFEVLGVEPCSRDLPPSIPVWPP